jgi:hypothetical protein
MQTAGQIFPIYHDCFHWCARITAAAKQYCTVLRAIALYYGIYVLFKWQSSLFLITFSNISEEYNDSGSNVNEPGSDSQAGSGSMFSEKEKLFCRVFFFFWFNSPQWAMASSFTRFLDHTQRRITVVRAPLDEWSARRRNLYLTTHNTLNRHPSMPPAGFETTVSAGERPQIYVLDRSATGTSVLQGNEPRNNHLSNI